MIRIAYFVGVVDIQATGKKLVLDKYTQQPAFSEGCWAYRVTKELQNVAFVTLSEKVTPVNLPEFWGSPDVYLQYYFRDWNTMFVRLRVGEGDSGRYYLPKIPYETVEYAVSSENITFKSAFLKETISLPIEIASQGGGFEYFRIDEEATTIPVVWGYMGGKTFRRKMKKRLEGAE